MSKRHQVSRRRVYGRRQHEIHERRDRDGQPVEGECDLDDGFGLLEVGATEYHATEYHATPYRAAWLGIE